MISKIIYSLWIILNWKTYYVQYFWDNIDILFSNDCRNIDERIQLLFFDKRLFIQLDK